MLVGRVMTEKSLNRAAMKEILAKAWGSQASQEGFGGGSLVRHGTSSQPPELGPGDFCVRVKIAKILGDIVMIENPFVDKNLLRQFFRIRVMINIKKPLFTGFWLPRKDLPRVCIFIKYERLSSFCYNCGIIGHDFRKCKKEKEMAACDNSRPHYGPTLGVLPAKSLAAIATENAFRIRKMKTGENDESAHGDRLADKRDYMPTNSDADKASQQCPNASMHSGGQQYQHCRSTTSTTMAPDQTPSQIAEKKKEWLDRVLGLEMWRTWAFRQSSYASKRKFSKDYPSPTLKGTGKYGIELTVEEIKKCKSSWLFMPQKEDNRNSENQQTAQQYVVNFPPEPENQKSPPPLCGRISFRG
ncbi:Zinc finger, CCHC-type [Sesbania bispinosa]|nr:Zinc finger, CCHC-type [Sesbania bispinosa]